MRSLTSPRSLPRPRKLWAVVVIVPPGQGGRGASPHHAPQGVPVPESAAQCPRRALEADETPGRLKGLGLEGR